MNQISLFCPHCGGTLEISDYSKLLTEKNNRTVACYWCGRVVINCDVNEPAYLEKLRAAGKKEK